MAIVDHNRHHRRQHAIGRDLARADQLLPEQGGIGHDAQRHEAFGGRLELQKQQQKRVRAVAARDAPDHVALAALAGFRMELRVEAFHALEVEIGKIDPGAAGAGHERAEQLRHHAGIAEQPVMERVVVRLAGCRHGATFHD